MRRLLITKALFKMKTKSYGSQMIGIYLLLILCFQLLNSRGSLAYLNCLDSENQHFSPVSLLPEVIVLPGKGPQGE